MMEIASIISNHDLNKSLIFIAFSGEELGLLGSRAWVNDNDEILGDTIAGICLDGVGRGEKISIMFADEESRILADLVLNISEKLGFENFKKENDYRGLTGTDSGAFFGRGIKIIRLLDEDRTYIHTKKDLPETLYPNRLIETAKVILASLFSLLNKPSEILFEKNHSEDSKKNESDQINKWILIGVISLISLFLAFYKKRLVNQKAFKKKETVFLKSKKTLNLNC
jgi:Zn-dependent M28 family amino/carboxypeptidase